MSEFLPVLLLAHLAATLFMTGVIWFVQVVHYPLMARVGTAGFAAYEMEHQRRATWVVLPAMILELTAAIGIAVVVPGELPTIGLGLLAVIWSSTFLIQVPCHERLRQGFDPVVHRRLVISNWLRTAAWSVRTGVAYILV